MELIALSTIDRYAKSSFIRRCHVYILQAVYNIIKTMGIQIGLSTSVYGYMEYSAVKIEICLLQGWIVHNHADTQAISEIRWIVAFK